MTIGRVPVESDLIPYAAGFPPGSRWLVLAPHPDDEVFGIGATLALGVLRGVHARVVVVTDGGAQGKAGEREAEARAAAEALGLPEPEFWRLADRSLRSGDPGLSTRLAKALERHRPDVLFVTSPVEFHPDHRALALVVRRVLRASSFWGLRRAPVPWIASYEVAAPLRPNLLVAADEGWDAKKRAGRCYAGQIAVRPYDEVMEAFGTLRSLTLDGVRKAEALHLDDARRVAFQPASIWAARVGTWGGSGNDRPG